MISIDDYYSHKLKAALERNSATLHVFLERISPKISELTPLVREKFQVNEDPRSPAYVLYDIEKLDTLLNEYLDNLRLVVRVFNDRVLYAIEQVESRTHTKQILILVHHFPNKVHFDGLVELKWIDELSMAYAFGLYSYTSDALNNSYVSLIGYGAEGKTFKNFVDLFDSRHFE